MSIPRKDEAFPYRGKSKRLTKTGVVLIVLFVVVPLIILATMSHYAPVKKDPSEERAFTAWAMHNEFIKNLLKAPATADFAPRSASSVEILGNNLYKITSYVDAQNSFGAKLRTHYTITLKNTGDQWKVADVQFF
ncbi:MAG: hypothetical protein ACLPX5_09265 [Dissulfurispiraceae bacterium]